MRNYDYEETDDERCAREDAAAERDRERRKHQHDIDRFVYGLPVEYDDENEELE